MEKLKSLIHKYVFSEELALNARMTNLVYIVGLVTAAVVTVSRFFIVHSPLLTTMMIVITFSVLAGLYLRNRFRAYSRLNYTILTLLGNILFPIMFFMLGGIEGGMGAYFVLSIVLIFLLAKGREFLFLSIHVVVIMCCYYASYRYPELVVEFTPKQGLYDSVMSSVIVGLFIGVVIKFQDTIYLMEKKKAEDASAALARQGELMCAVNNVAVMLLTHEEDKFEQALIGSIEMMAECVDVDCVHIWKNYLNNGALFYSELYEWRESDGLRQGRAGEFMEFPYAQTLPRWEKLFYEKKCVNGPVSSLPNDERLRLSPYGILSILVMPVFLQDRFWGFVSFDDRREERVFPQDEVDILQSGSLLLVNSIVQDEMMKEMREARQRTKIMLDATPLCCLLWNKDFNLIDCNEEALKMFEISNKRHYLDRFFLYSPEYQPDGQASLEAAYEHLQTAFRYGRDVFEWVHQTLSGKLIPSQVTLVRVRLGDEEIAAGYVYNLLEYKNMMAALDKRLEQQLLMSDIAQSFISDEDMAELIKDALRKVGEFLNATRVLIVEAGEEGRTLYAWYSSDKFMIDSTKENLKDALEHNFPKTKSSKEIIQAIRCEDISSENKYKILSCVGLKAFIWAPLYFNGEYRGMICIDECVTAPRLWSESDAQLVGMISGTIAGAMARATYEQQRTDALEQAMKASKAKGDFLSNMSHEMRTPMNAIIGMTSIGKSASTLEKKDYSFEKIEGASIHLLGVINDILDMSKIEANKLELSPADFDFEKMLQKVVNVVNFRVEERQQKFHVSIDRAIPNNLIADDQRLAQVITNLLSNAVKFTPEGGSISLSSRLIKEEGKTCTIQIEVVDTGIGITKEQQSRLFNSFEQAESGTSRKFGGTGLGLAISKRIVEMMGGKIWIESEEGKGTKFALTIEAGRGEKVRDNVLDHSVNWNNVRILAVDDAAEVLEYFDEIALRFGVACDTAINAEKALELVQKNGPYDIYFIDWKMPKVDGIELTRNIKRIDAAKSVVIMISSNEWNTIEHDATSAGVNKFLPKPLFPSSIADCINQCLGLNRENTSHEKEEEFDDFEGRRVLLVEDVDINREIVQALLEPTKLEIECAEDGAVAVRMFSSAPERYEMIFMDVQMPKMDGYEATRKIRAIDLPVAKTIPIVAMTANVFREDIEKCIDCGMDDHVGKPLDTDEVLEKLRKYLNK